MALTTYTSYDTIRGLLGVNDKELEDAVMAGAVYEHQLLLAFEDVDDGEGNVYEQFTTINAIAEVDRTAAQQSFWQIVGVFSAYHVANQLLESVEMFAPKQITDGAAAVTRGDGAYKALRTALPAALARVRSRLVRALLILVPSADVQTAAARTSIVSTGLATDPVTNE
jgi:hypothetical protein